MSSNTGIHCKVYVVINPDTLQTIENSKVLHSEFHNSAAPIVAAQSAWHIQYFFLALGYQDGEVSLLRYCTAPFLFESLTKFHIDGPVSSLVLFEHETDVIDLLVVGAVGYCVLYKDISQENIEDKIIIKPPSNDVLTTATATDIDFDGQKEIVIGSFSKELFCYKLFGNQAQLIWKFELVYPIQCISEFDINKDGVNELIVVSMYGVSIISPNYDLAREKLKAVKEFLSKS